MTIQDAIQSLSDEIIKRGKFNIGNVFDSAFGIAKDNAEDLQKKINDLLGKSGTLSPADEAEVKDILNKRAEAEKKRKQIRTKNLLIAGGAVAVLGTVIYLLVKKK